MDLWVVAAAAGAGYLAKYWQNILREREGSSESFSRDFIRGNSGSRASLQQLRDRTNSCHRLGEDVSSNSDGRFSEGTRIGGGASATEMASTSELFDSEDLVNCGKYDNYNVLSLSCLPPGGFSRKKYHQDNGDGSEEVDDKSGGEIVSHYRSSRSRSSLRSKWSSGFSVKPLSSIESCLIAQLYKEHVKMDEYVFSSLPSPSTSNVRPLFVTDGNQVISRASSDSLKEHLDRGKNKLLPKEGRVYFKEKESVLGVPPLPEIGPMELPRKLKQRRGKGWLGRLNTSSKRVSAEHFHSQGSPDGMLLFCLGITLGVMSTVKETKREVGKLNELLKQTENLVQDLQEELEMKDSLTVKELVNEGYGLQETNDLPFHNLAPTVFFPEQDPHQCTEYDGKDPQDQKADENSESMSKIEAELAAELERLELNLNASSFERRLSGLAELDPDFVAEIVQGELRADMISGGAGGQADSDQDVSGTSTTNTHCANYAVSPRELSLRLHEVIESRQEERIRELETALHQSQKRINFMESEWMYSQRDLLNSDIGSSSTQESPTLIEEDKSAAQPLVLNLSGDELGAHNEAYEEFMRITETEEPSYMVYYRKQIDKEGLNLPEQIRFQDQNLGKNESMPHLKFIKERQSRNLICEKIRTWEERISRSRGSTEVGESDDEEDDEMGKLLIKQIVEKTRQGSPVVLNAQRMLFAMDEKLPLQ